MVKKDRTNEEYNMWGEYRKNSVICHRAVGRPLGAVVTARHDALVRHWLGEVSKASLPLESRWTLLALKRVDVSVAQALHEQRGMFDQACLLGSVDDVETHGAAMCRGLAVAVRTLEQASEPDDAYQLGSCPRTGFRVAIGYQKAAEARIRELHGSAVCWVSPDEVASLLSGMESFKFVSAVKNLFPGSEIIDRYPDEPAKQESGVDIVKQESGVAA